MRLTPSQIAVRLICGESSPHAPDESLLKRIQRGQDFLVSITREDFGYDLQAWHNHLKESREGGYTYRRNIVLPRIMQAALQAPEWQEAVRNLRSRRT
jgi:hypothetical protein